MNIVEWGLATAMTEHARHINRHGTPWAKMVEADRRALQGHLEQNARVIESLELTEPGRTFSIIEVAGLLRRALEPLRRWEIENDRESVRRRREALRRGENQ